MCQCEHQRIELGLALAAVERAAAERARAAEGVRLSEAERQWGREGYGVLWFEQRNVERIVATRVQQVEAERDALRKTLRTIKVCVDDHDADCTCGLDALDNT